MSDLQPFDYNLPEELIAQEPLAIRSDSRLLALDRFKGSVRHMRFHQVTELLRPGDLLVLNNTKVTALRLYGHKETGARVEALLMSNAEAPGTFIALMRPGKRLRPGDNLTFEEGVKGTILENRGEGKMLLHLQSDGEPLESALERIGLAPLPPYIHAPLHDRGRYQTVYATEGGSSAAPTAGLHFTSELFNQLDNMGVQRAFVTLSVGLDTFRPVEADRLDDHPMHGEWCSVSPETAEAIQNCQGRVIAVGTTSVRTLETHAVGPRQVLPGAKVSKLFIRPGFEFQIIDGMITNFHMPRTTMLLMLAALCGTEPLMNAYQEAISQKYRFLSFGDSMYIGPGQES